MSDNTLKPHMSEAELALFEKSVPRGGRALEFGSGGSTPHFFACGALSLVSVESDRAYLEHLSRLPELQGKKWLPIHASIGNTGDWGRPLDPAPNPAWLNYHQICWDLMPAHAFAFILIDGRFRVACLCQSLLRCTHDDPLILVHDFWPRQHYHVMLDYCDVVDRADTSVLLRRKRGLDWRALALTLQKHQFEPE